MINIDIKKEELNTLEMVEEGLRKSRFLEYMKQKQKYSKSTEEEHIIEWPKGDLLEKLKLVQEKIDKLTRKKEIEIDTRALRYISDPYNWKQIISEHYT